MTKEEVIKQIELELEQRNTPYELTFPDFIKYRNKEINPKEEIEKIVNLYREHPTNTQVRSQVTFEYQRIVLMRDNPNWMDELKDKYIHIFKKFIVLGLIPGFLLICGFNFITDEISLLSRGEFSSIPNVYHLQFWVMNIVIPFYIYNPKHYLNRRWNDVYLGVVKRYNLGGNVLFFSSLILLPFTNFYSSNIINLFQTEQNLTWVDVRGVVIPLFIGFVFFNNAFLRNE